MRYLLCFACVLTALAVWPLRAVAQTPSVEADPGGSGISERVRKRTRQQWDPTAYEIRLDADGLQVSGSAPRRGVADSRVLQYRQGLIVSSLFLGVGAGLMGAGFAIAQNQSSQGDWIPVGGIMIFSLGTVMAAGGLIGMLVTGGKLGARKRELRSWDESAHARPRRAQWDLEASRWVF